MIKSYWQSFTRGYNDKELWDLDHTIAKFILPRLKAFRERNTGCPPEILPKYSDDDWEQAHQLWDEALDKMILAFELVIEGEANAIDEWKAQQELKKEGLALFGKYFEALWL